MDCRFLDKKRPQSHVRREKYALTSRPSHPNPPSSPPCPLPCLVRRGKENVKRGKHWMQCHHSVASTLPNLGSVAQGWARLASTKQMAGRRRVWHKKRAHPYLSAQLANQPASQLIAIGPIRRGRGQRECGACRSRMYPISRNIYGVRTRTYVQDHCSSNTTKKVKRTFALPRWPVLSDAKKGQTECSEKGKKKEKEHLLESFNKLSRLLPVILCPLPLFLKKAHVLRRNHVAILSLSRRAGEAKSQTPPSISPPSSSALSTSPLSALPLLLLRSGMYIHMHLPF